MAYDIFRLNEVKVIKDDSKLPLSSFRNGSKRPPEYGCLLIWNEGGFFEYTGHVAVVIEVLEDRIRIIEQNVEDAIWPEGQEYSRELKMTRTKDGGYFVKCTYDDASVLGWVIQTDDSAYADKIQKIDPMLFRIMDKKVQDNGKANTPWLDRKLEDESAYIAMMGGCKLSSREKDDFRYFVMSATAEAELKCATNELHGMFMHATNLALQNEDILQHFNLPPELWPRIQKSWNNRRNEMITGRFDFCLTPEGPKLYEYNSDSASCHMECGKIQGRWAEHFGCSEGENAGRQLFDLLWRTWSRTDSKGIIHVMHDHSAEESYHALYMRSALEKAGIKSKVIEGLSGIRWDEKNNIVDADGVIIERVWKTWAWETALDEIRHQIEEEGENLRLHRTIDKKTSQPRLVDVFLRPEVMVFEPLWTLIPSNKAILPILWGLYPNHPYLLKSEFTLSKELEKAGYVAKPIVGRCGENIQIYSPNQGLVQETKGKFDTRALIYQALCPLPKIGGDFVQISTFSVGGTYGGACIRLDQSPIITSNSDLVALRVLEDSKFLKP